MSKIRQLFLFTCAMGITLPSMLAQFLFDAPLVSDCGSDSREITFINLNEDEHLDVAVVNFSAGTVTPMISDGFGKYDCVPAIVVGDFPTDIATGDFDGDSQPDIVLLTQETNQETVLLYGKGDGIFDELMNLELGSPNDVVVTDFNVNMIPDLGIAEGFSTVKTLLGQEDGMFTLGGTATVGDAPIVLFADDFNRDGIPDLITGHGLSNDFSIIFGDGTGGFSEPIFYPTDGNPWDFKFIDVTGDDFLDLIVAVNDEVSVIEVYKGDGTGSFTLFNTIPTAAQPLGLAVADFNNDNWNDLVVSVDNLNEDNIVVYQGNGAGLFIENIQLSTVGFPSQLLVDDINKDGLPDLVVNDHRISVFLNTHLINTTRPVAAKGHFSISPNPASTDALNIQFDNPANNSNTHILIINNLGKVVYQQQHNNSEQLSIPLNDFNNGIYWIKIENEAFIASEKLVVSR